MSLIIAVGNSLRRLAVKCASFYAIDRLAQELSPRQLEVGVAGGCEAAVHAVRRFLPGSQKGDIVVKLDFSNAFNSIHRGVILKAVSDNIPKLYRFRHLAYFIGLNPKVWPVHHNVIGGGSAGRPTRSSPLLFIGPSNTVISDLKTSGWLLHTRRVCRLCNSGC